VTAKTVKQCQAEKLISNRHPIPSSRTLAQERHHVPCFLSGLSIREVKNPGILIYPVCDEEFFGKRAGVKRRATEHLPFGTGIAAFPGHSYPYSVLNFLQVVVPSL